MRWSLVGIALIVGGVAFGVWGHRAGHDELPFPEIAELRVELGDLVFRRREGFLSRRVLEADPDTTYSHVGMVVATDPITGRARVVHVVPAIASEPGSGRVRVEGIESFLAPPETVAAGVYRVVASRDVRNRAAVGALRYWREGRRFDNAFDLEDQKRLYCTELVWAAYREAGIELSSSSLTEFHLPGLGQRRILLPSDLEHSEDVIPIRTIHLSGPSGQGEDR